MNNKVIVEFVNHKSGESADIQLDLSITGIELFVGLNQAFELGCDTDNIDQCYLSMENPIALIKGNRTLQEIGLRDGSVIHFVR